jgi:hypothetical protein
VDLNRSESSRWRERRRAHRCSPTTILGGSSAEFRTLITDETEKCGKVIRERAGTAAAPAATYKNARREEPPRISKARALDALEDQAARISASSLKTVVGLVFLEGGAHLLDELGSLLDTHTHGLRLIIAYDE